MSAAEPHNAPRTGTEKLLPWAEIMAFGFGILRLSPDAFWNLTIPELKAALRGRKGGFGAIEPLPRDAFAALMQRFPDQPEGPKQNSDQDRPERSRADDK